MHYLWVPVIAVFLLSCSPAQVAAILGDKLLAQKFAIKCEARDDNHLAAPDSTLYKFPVGTPYTEKYCSLFYDSKPWDGPYQSIGWGLPIGLSSVSSPNPDGSEGETIPFLHIFDLKAPSIRKGAVQMGILGVWGTGDHVASFNQKAIIKTSGVTYTIAYIISPIPDDFVSVAVDPGATMPVIACDDGNLVSCLSDDNGNYWTSLIPLSRGRSCSAVIPVNRVDDVLCDGLPASQSCPMPSVYCADLGSSKIGWQTMVQSVDCSEAAEYPVSSSPCG